MPAGWIFEKKEKPMNDFLKEFQEDLPEWWTKKFKSQKLIDLVADQGQWFGRPRPLSAEGKKY